MAMKKSDLVQLAAEKTRLSQQEVRNCLDVILGAIGEEMKKGGEVNKMPQRTVKLPNGQSSVVLERENVKFKAFSNIRLYNVKY